MNYLCNFTGRDVMFYPQHNRDYALNLHLFVKKRGTVHIKSLLHGYLKVPEHTTSKPFNFTQVLFDH